MFVVGVFLIEVEDTEETEGTEDTEETEGTEEIDDNGKEEDEDLYLSADRGKLVFLAKKSLYNCWITD